MSARNSAKAIVLHNGKILVNRCISKYGEYYRNHLKDETDEDMKGALLYA